MKKHKGYQKDMHKVTYRCKEHSNSFASGINMPIEQYLQKINACFDERVKAAMKEYERISSKTTLVGKELKDYCREWLMWEVKFDKDCNLIPLRYALEQIENERRKYVERRRYRYVRRITNKDNQKFTYNTGSSSSGSRNRVRIPSLKRSDATWRRFYELFPYYKEHYNELNNKNGVKLKKVW